MPDMTDRSLRGKVAVVGVGETTYYRHGKSPDSEFKLALQAILAACADAGMDPREIDGFASFSNDRNESSRLAAALGIRELRFSGMQWGGGGGGAAGAVGLAASAIHAGMADRVIIFRALAQGQFARYGQGGQADAGAATVSGDHAFSLPYGAISPAQRFAMKTMRFMHDHGVDQSALRAIALASYHHAQQNPRAVMRGRPLDEAAYDASRWIVEPYRLFDCCQENDGAAALLLAPSDSVTRFRSKPAFLLGIAAGSDHRAGASAHNAPNYASASFTTVAPRLYAQARLGPSDIDVVQSYENFTGGVVMALAEHGFFRPEEANEVLQLPNLVAPTGRLPLNTSGGHLAECYMHGANLIIEAVRQIRGESCNQVANAATSMMISGPMVTPVSSLIVGSEATL
jgi:acetyl-CoA acetyltransferase